MISRSQSISRAMLEKYLKSTKVWKCKVWLQKVAPATYSAAIELSCSLGEQNGSPSEPQNEAPEAPAPKEISFARFACSLGEQNLR